VTIRRHRAAGSTTLRIRWLARHVEIAAEMDRLHSNTSVGLQFWTDLYLMWSHLDLAIADMS